MYVMELKDLLSDLRVYLGETLAREKLCTTAEEQRQRLLARLGGQPPPPSSTAAPAAISATTNTPGTIIGSGGIGYIGGCIKNSSPSPPPPAYIDMSRSSTLTSTINSSKSDLNCYELMSDCSPTSGKHQITSGSTSVATPNTTTTTSINGGCGNKSGRLGRRERFLFVGQTKKCWASLLTMSPQPQLNLYAHQGDVKAHTTLQLEGYQARPLASLANGVANNNTGNGVVVGTNKTESNSKQNNTTFEIFCPGKKTYQFTAESSMEMLSWVEAINEACLRHKRQLPSVPPHQTYDVPQPPPLPHHPQELYDTPDSRIRPVTPTTPNNHHHQQDYERMHDSLYHIIDDKRRPKQEQLYKNVGIDEDDDETCYYNLVPRAAEDIYQTITETGKCITATVNNTNNTNSNSNNNNNISNNNNNNNNNINNRSAPQNRIQAIIQAMEASIAEAQLYEPVDTSQELSR